LPNGSILHQQVVYETLPWFCKHCRTLGHITSTCTKSQPPNVLSTQRAHDSVAPIPKGRDSVFNRLGPQGGTSVIECPKANLPADCEPNSLLVEAELVSESGATAPNSSDWELVRNKKVRRKPSPSRNSFGSPHVEPYLAQGNSHMVHRDCQPSPPLLIARNISAPAPKDLASHRIDKGKFVVISGAPGNFSYSPIGMPIRRRA
jgi:hypothetical protein